MAQPLGGEDPSWTEGPAGSAAVPGSAAPEVAPGPGPAPGGPAPGPPAVRPVGGKPLGVFRNTYYNFPSEADYKGPTTKLMSGTCSALADVPRSFHDTVCVQGSGLLRSGVTVSFARRDCECAEVCPRSGQKICFDALDKGQFPWGRGATGRPITPQLSVAVDTTVIELGTPLYIPDFDGIPRDEGGMTRHDGCFIAQDRGSRVQGNHIDIFTGQERLTTLWNGLVPSNKGVTVIVGSPRCQRAAAP